MSQFGFGIGPNGQFGPMFMITGSSQEVEPQTWEGHFLTEDNVVVKCVFNTPDKTLADRYCREITAKMAWRDPPPPVVEPETLAGKIATAWLTAVMIPLAAVAFAFIGAIGANMANFITFSTFNDILSNSIRYAMWSCPIIGFILTGVAIFTHSSQKMHA